MKKKLVTLVLVIALVCTMFVGAASARTYQTTFQGYSAAAVLNWSGVYDGAYATTSYGTSADVISASVNYTYNDDGTLITVSSGTITGYNRQSIEASKYVSGSVEYSARSTHKITEGVASWTYPLSI